MARKSKSKAPRTTKGGVAYKKYDESKHKRGLGGQFASKPGVSKGVKTKGSVGQAHTIYDKVKASGGSNKDMLAAAQAAGINPNTAKTQLYHWQKKQATKEVLSNATGAPTKAELRAAAAKALGGKPTPAPEPKITEAEMKAAAKAKAKAEEKAAKVEGLAKAKAVKPEYDKIANDSSLTFQEKVAKLKGLHATKMANAQSAWEKEALSDNFSAAHNVSIINMVKPGTPLPTPVRPAPTPAPAPAEPPKAEWTKVGGKMGSNEGGTYQNKDGSKVYAKTAKSEDHLQNELLANRFYEKLGVSTLSPQRVKIDGKDHIASPIQKIEKFDPNNPSHVADAKKDFAVHAWLANRDAVGMSFDNLGYVNGKLTMLDAGGSLKYRAQGALKNDYDNHAKEWNTLRDPSVNPQTAKVFGKMTDDELATAAKKLEAISDKEILDMVEAHGLPSMEAGKLMNRKKAILDQIASLKPSIPVVSNKPAPDLAKLGPVKYTHALADHMVGKGKKEVVAAAVAAGVNKSTAGVQYAKWAKAQEGAKPEVKTSPEPAPLQAKKPSEMSDKELDTAIDSYKDKVSAPGTVDVGVPKPHGAKNITAAMPANTIFYHSSSAKTFYKAHNGSVHEFKVDTAKAGPMTHVAGPKAGSYHYDPNNKAVSFVDGGGKHHPMTEVKEAVFKPPVAAASATPKPQVQPDDPHYFSDHPWTKSNGYHNPNTGYHVTEQLKEVHQKAGVTYNNTNSGVKSYTGSGHMSMNANLRNGKPPSDKVKAIDNLIAKSSFQEETVMWRGIGPGGTVWNGSPPPAELTDLGLCSTSFKPSVAKGFSDGKTIFRVKVPKGFPGLNVAIGSPPTGVIGLGSEAEVLLPRGTTFKVVQRHKDAAKKEWGSGSYDVVDLEPNLPQWYVEKYGWPKDLAQG